MKNTFIMTFSILLVAPFALANKAPVGQWEYESVVCGVPGYSPSEMPIVPESTAIFKDDGSFQIVSPIPHPSFVSCSLLTEGTYSVTESKVITEPQSVKLDVECLKSLRMSEEAITNVEAMFKLSEQRRLQIKEQEFVIEGGHLYTEHDLSASLSETFCEDGETLFFKSSRPQ